MPLQKKLAELSKKPSRASVPSIFNLSSESDQSALMKILETRTALQVIDTFDDQVRELFAIKKPPAVFGASFESALDDFRKRRTQVGEAWIQGRWVYFPWIESLVHLLADEEYQLVRTSRNRELISEDEQRAFYESTVGIAGLSVGNSVALTLVLSGGAKHLKLADFDSLDLSNLNRIRAGVADLGLSKVEITARQIYLLNPYAEVETFSDGLTKESIQDFFIGLDIIVDELDSLPIKYLVREEARKHKIPVVMAADCDESGIIDIERYDRDPQIEFFHGRLGGVQYEHLANLDKRSIGKRIAQLVGLENHNERMLQSLQGLGSTLVSWPQLGSTATLNSAALTYCIRKILTQQDLISDRAVISFDALLDPTYQDVTRRASRDAAIQTFKKIFGL
jgi:molybdopterin/thiamine biosynthesis adenylyltransferase